MIGKPVVERLPEATLKAIPKLLKPAEKINLDQLKVKLSAMRKGNEIKGDNSGIIMIWSAMLSDLVVIAAIRTAIWNLKMHRQESIDSVLHREDAN